MAFCRQSANGVALMVKVLIGLVAAAVLAIAGFFGFEFYVQHRVDSELEASFAPIRAAGGKASHGAISFDALSRTIRIADIATESAGQLPAHLKIASVTASGVGLSDATRFSAETIEATDIEAAVQAGWSLAYKAPKLVIKDYSGPAGQQQPLAGSTAVDIYRFALQQFAAMTASSVTAPSHALELSIPSASGAQAVSYSYVYTKLALNDIKQGRIGAMTAERAAYTANIQQNGRTEKLAGEAANLAMYDFDSGAVLAMLDPARANDDQYIRSYRQVSVGVYTVSLPNGARMRMDGFTIDDVGLRPSKLQLPQLIAMISSMPSQGTPPSPAQTRDLLQKMAGLYEGVRIGNAEMRGLSIETPQGPFALAAFRFNLENGKIGEFALEGLDGRSPQGPLKIGRFAVKSLDIANLLRSMSDFSTPGQTPSPDRLFGLLQLVDGAEIKGLVAPFKNTNKQVNVDTISLNWGQFVGPIPTKARLAAKFATPIDASDPAQKQFIAAGMTTAAMDFDLGAAWTEASGAFVLDPLTFDFGDVLKVSARVALANVPRAVFSTDLPQAMATAAQIEAGSIALTLQDVGGVDLVVAQFARTQNVSREAARRAIVDSIKTSAKAKTDNADALAVADALGRFIDNPRGTLIIKLTPLGKVPALQLVQLIKTDPFVALAQFQIEVSSGL
jgi:hypothetical protein